MQIVGPRSRGFISEWIREYFEGANIGDEPLGYGDRPVILVIDLQKSGSSARPPPLAARAATNTAVLVDRARARGVPVIYTVNAFREDLRDLPPTKLKSLASCVVGTRLVEVLDAVAPQAGDLVLQKTTHSA